MNDLVIDGYTLEELSDYAASGRAPVDIRIENSPECLAALAALEYLAGETELLFSEETQRSANDSGWIARMMDGIRLDVQAGRSIPISHADSDAMLAITEGAVRALIRAMGDRYDGVIVGRCRLEGDIESTGAPIRVVITLSMRYGLDFRAVSKTFQNDLYLQLSTHTEINVVSVETVVTDVLRPLSDSVAVDGQQVRSEGVSCD